MPCPLFPFFSLRYRSLRYHFGGMPVAVLALLAVSLPLGADRAMAISNSPVRVGALETLAKERPAAVPRASHSARIHLADHEIDDLYQTLQRHSPTDITKDFQGLRESPLSSEPTDDATAMTRVEALQEGDSSPSSSEAVSTLATESPAASSGPSKRQARQQAKATAKAEKKARQQAEKQAQKAARQAAETLSTKPAAAASAAAPASDPATTPTAGEVKPADDASLASLQPALRADMEQLGQRMRFQHDAIRNELRDDQELALTDITLLWQAAVERSGAIRYAIEKLSRRDAVGKPLGDSFTKRVFQNIVRLGGVAGSMWTGTPAGVLGGSLVEDVLRGDPTTSAMGRVTDADMLLLAKEVESLQTQVIEAYYTYRQAQDQWKLAHEATVKLDAYYQRTLDAPAGSDASALKPVLDAMFESLQQEEQNAKQAFVSARNALGLMVGGEVLLTLEQAHQSKPTAKPTAQKPVSAKPPLAGASTKAPSR